MKKIKFLVFGTGLLGSAFWGLDSTVVLSRKQCDITKKDEILNAINLYNPQHVINAAGVVPKAMGLPEEVFRVNSFAPHYISDVCLHKKCNFVHVSTDCVFSGEKGNYTEKDSPDATDMYGMSKIFGEPTHFLTIRTSFIGLPDPKGRGLLAWAQNQEELIGYDKTFWNGITTTELVKIIRQYAQEEIKGVRHIYSYTVSKYELLQCAKDVFGWTMPLHKESDTSEKAHISNKTLGSIYGSGFIAKPLRRQLKELYADAQR